MDTAELHDGILDGLDTLLGMVENSEEFDNNLSTYFGKGGAQAIKGLMTYGTIDHKGFEYLSNIDPEMFDSFFLSIDFSVAGHKLGLEIPDNFISAAAFEFKKSITEALSRYQIFKCFYEEGTQRYEEVVAGKDFQIFYDSKDGWHYLKLGKNFIPDENFRDDYFKTEEGYLFFIDTDKSYCFNKKTGQLIELSGEYIESYVIGGKTYIHLAYPNEESPTEYNIHCIEDDHTFNSFINKQGGHLMKLVEINGRVCAVLSSYQKYNGFHKGNKVEKGKLSTEVKDIYSGEIILDSEGILKDIIVIDGITVLITQRKALIGDSYEKSRLKEAENITRLNKRGENDFSNCIDNESIVEIIQTDRDIIYIFKGMDNSFYIFSPFQYKGVGKTLSGDSISAIEKIEQNTHGVEITYKLFSGETGVFLSNDFPSKALH